MFDNDTVCKLVELLTDTELAIFLVFFQSLCEQAQNENHSLILEVGRQGVDLVSNDLTLGIGASRLRMNEGYQIA